MKILAITPTAGLSGVDQTFLYLCSGLAGSGHDVIVIIPQKSEITDSLLQSGVRVIESNNIKWWFNPAFYDEYLDELVVKSKKSISNLVDIINDYNPDIVLSNTSVFLDGVLAAKITGKKHIVHLHALFVDNIYSEMSIGIKKSIYEIFSSYNSYIVTPSSQIKSDLIEKFEIDKNKIFVVENGVNTNLFSRENDKIENKKIILSLGHYNDNKNQKFLIKVADALKKNGISDFTFFLAGPPEKQYFDELKNEISKAGVSDCFCLMEQQNNVKSLLENATIYVNTSKTETFPISILEAMAMELPIVCTETIGGIEIVNNGINGFVINSEDEMAEKIAFLLSDEKVCKLMGEKSKLLVNEKYSVEKFVNNFESIFYLVNSNNFFVEKESWIKNLFMKKNNEIRPLQTRIAIIVPDKNQTSFSLLIKKPFNYFENKYNDFDCVVFSYHEINSLRVEEFDVLYVFRIYANPIPDLIKNAKSNGLTVIFESDDNYFALKFENGNPVHGSFENNELSDVLRASDKIIVYSDKMLNSSIKYNSNVLRMKTYQITPNENIESKQNNDLIVGFMGSLKKDIDFQFVTPALLRLLNEYQDLKLEFFGFVPDEFIDNKRVYQCEFNPDYDKFIEKFRQRNWTVALAPLAITEFNQSKTNNKYREYAAAGFPGVYSNAKPYLESVINYETGLIVENETDDWYWAIKTLLDNEPLRKKISTNAFGDIKENYSFVNYCESKYKILKNLKRRQFLEIGKEKAGDTKLIYPFKNKKFNRFCSLKLSSIQYCSLNIVDFNMVLNGLNIFVDDACGIEDFDAGIEIVENGEIVMNIPAETSAVSDGKVIQFRFSKPTKFTGNVEIRIFAIKNNQRSIKILGVSNYLSLKKIPLVEFIM